jgi:diacylglycerol kinase (ATP)
LPEDMPMDTREAGDAAGDAGRVFSFSDRARSFLYAGRGITHLLRAEHNAWIHMLATLLAVGLGLFFGLTALEWCAIVLAIVAVWVSEAFNTALELLADVVSPEQHPAIGSAKDVAAGAVLLAALGAVAIGVLVLGPHCLALLGG